jgi:hypothetical protein
MQRFSRFLFLGVLCLLFSGCLQSMLLITVESDGSGTIELTIIPGEMMAEMLAGFEEEPSMMPDESFFDSLATRFGQGVSFVSSESVDDTGIRAFFSFADINTLSIGEDAPSQLLQAQGVSSTSENKDPLRFEFTPGSVARLVIYNDPLEEPEATPEDEDEVEAMDPEEAIEMMKFMMGDMHMTAVVEVNGSIQETNAKFHEGSRITLLDFEMNKLLDDEELLQQMAESTGPSPELVAALARNGVAIEQQEVISVVFK